MFGWKREWTHLIPEDNVHPYGRRRVVNGRTGAMVLKVVDMLCCSFIIG